MKSPPKGVVALITVLAVMAVMVGIGVVISSVGLNQVVLSRVVQDGETAFSIADACVEEGINRFKLDGAYAGGSFMMDGGACTIAVTNLGGNDRLIVGTGSYADAIRIIEANVTLKFNIAGNAKKVTINSWVEGP